MALIKRFEDMIAWQKARELNKMIYTISKKEGFNTDYPLSNQIRRSSLSTMGNIAEGFERGTTPQIKYFTNVALGSSGETRSHIYAAMDADYLSAEQFHEAIERAEEISRMLRSFIKSI